MSIPFAIGTTAIVVFTVFWSYRGFKDRRFTDKYVFSPPRILRDKQYYRLLSSGFLHLNWPHLLLNMLSLYLVGEAIEWVYGFGTLFTVFFGSVIGGNLLSLYLHRNHDYYQALGASGGVCGVIFASIFLFPGGWIRLFMMIPMPSWLYAILFILVTFVGLRNQWGNIGHDAHLGGAIIGLLITTVLHPQIVPRSPVLYTVVIGLSVVLLIDLYRHPFYQPGMHPLSRRYLQYRWTEAQARRRARQEQQDRETMNRLLDKISRSGMDSLTILEKRQLKGISKRMRESKRIH
jgi:membrane associated rhomboid family serine protease